MNPLMEQRIANSLSDDYEHALKELAQVLSHRLRSLVAGIEGYTDLLAETLGTREQRELALRIMEGTSRIERVLADLQHYSRELDPVMMPTSVQEILAGVVRTLPDRDLEALDITPCECDCELEADPILLPQAIIALVTNMLESAAGRGALKISCTKEEAHFVFHNDGVIPPDDAANAIYTPFFTTKAKNLGIGLPQAKRIVEAHGGTLTLEENDAARGITFLMKLPILQ